MPNYLVHIIEQIRYALVIKGPDEDSVREMDTNQVADTLSDNTGFIGVEERYIDNIELAEETDEVDHVLDLDT